MDRGQRVDLMLLIPHDTLGNRSDLLVRGLRERGLGGHDRQLVVEQGQIDEGQIRIIASAEGRYQNLMKSVMAPSSSRLGGPYSTMG